MFELAITFIALFSAIIFDLPKPKHRST